MRALETRYRGHRFRSRLEARWAVFFDAIPLRWEYEPQGFDLGDGLLYLPDFYLPEVRVYAEVKGAEANPRERLKAERLALHTGRPVLLLEGPPEFREYPLCYPPGEPGTGPDDGWTDCVVTDEYAHDEHRFYVSLGDREAAVQHTRSDARYGAAVAASRAARFEHGERPDA